MLRTEALTKLAGGGNRNIIITSMQKHYSKSSEKEQTSGRKILSIKQGMCWCKQGAGKVWLWALNARILCLDLASLPYGWYFRYLQFW